MSPALNLVALDMSMTAAGLARVRITADGQTLEPEVQTVGEDGHKDDTDVMTLERHRRQALRYRNWLRAGVLEADDVTLLTVEGPVVHNKTAFAHKNAGMWWIALNYLMPDVTGLAVVNPSTVKRYATAYGGGQKHASKAHMMLAVDRMRPSLGVRDDNQADAFVMLDMLATELGHPLAVSPQRVGDPSARATVDWPDFVRTYRAARP